MNEKYIALGGPLAQQLLLRLRNERVRNVSRTYQHCVERRKNEEG